MSRPLLLALALLLAACQSAPSPTPAPVAIARILNFWQPVSDTLAEADQAWQFVGQTGDVVRLRALGDDVTLALHDSAGAPLGQGATIEATLPTDGIYTVTVSGSGAYQLGLSYTDRANPAEVTPSPLPQVVGVPTPTPPYYAALGKMQGAITSGAAQTGTFAGDTHVYTFEGQAGQYANIRLTRQSGAADPVLTLYAPDGAPLAMDDDSGGDRAAALRNIRLPDSGVYSLQADGGGFSGSYELSLFLSVAAFGITPTVFPQPTETPMVEVLTPTPGAALNDSRLSDHAPLIGSFTRVGDVFRYTFEAAAGQPVNVYAAALPGWNVRPRLEVYNPDGELVAAVDAAANGEALIADLVPAQSGVYLVYVTAGSATGDFMIVYGTGNSWQEVRRGRIEPDRPTNSTLLRRGQREVWSLLLRQGDVISAAIRPLSAGLTPLLELVAPDGSLVAQAESSGGGTDRLIAAARAPVTGLYLLRVTLAGAASGGYTLVWRAVSLAPTPTPQPALLPILAADDVAQRDNYRFYPFQGQAGQRVLIRVVAAPASRFDPVAALIAPDGEVIAEADDTDSSPNVEMIVSLPTDGTYTVRVNGYLSAGAFTLTVMALV
ncbi:MAG: hypothetical protein HZC41_05150 [Chloroflexi bacterium]|nr:hypothetical protein [Chloroflexota bacterium]